MVSITVKIDPGMNERVQRSLVSSGATLSDFVREAIEEKLARGQSKPSPYELAVEMGLFDADDGPVNASERSERKRRVKEAVLAKHRR